MTIRPKNIQSMELSKKPAAYQAFTFLCVSALNSLCPYQCRSYQLGVLGYQLSTVRVVNNSSGERRGSSQGVREAPDTLQSSSLFA